MSERTPDPARQHLPPGPARTVLLRGGEVHSPADPFATAMVVEGGRIAWVGEEGAADSFAGGVDEVVQLDGALVTPAFTDAHVHTTATGLALTGLDLVGVGTLTEALARIRGYADARPADRILLGHGWDASVWPEGRPPSRAELDEATGGRPLYLTRVDVHSAVVTTALLDLVPGIRERDGFHAGAPLTGAAHHAVRKAAYATVTAAQRAEAQAAALARAASLGIGTHPRVRGPGHLRRGRLHGAARPGRGRQRPSRRRLLGRGDRIRKGRGADQGTRGHRCRGRSVRRRLARIAHRPSARPVRGCRTHRRRAARRRGRRRPCRRLHRGRAPGGLPRHRRRRSDQPSSPAYGPPPTGSASTGSAPPGTVSSTPRCSPRPPSPASPTWP